VRLTAALALAITLAGCVTTSDVVPATQGMYTVIAANNVCGNCEPPESRATRRASAYCSKLNKTMVADDSEELETNFGFGDRYTLTFSCINATAEH
jgi:hypothetical protein